MTYSIARYPYDKMAGNGSVLVKKYCMLGGNSENTGMAETLKVRVRCHACTYMIEGSAKYGKGHYVPEGVDFEFVAIGKVETSKGRTVKAEVSCICPSCGVKCKFSV